MHFPIAANMFHFVDRVPIDGLVARNHIVNMKRFLINQSSYGCPSTAVVGAEEWCLVLHQIILNRRDARTDHRKRTRNQNPIDRPVALLAKGWQFYRAGLAIVGGHEFDLEEKANENSRLSLRESVFAAFFRRTKGDCILFKFLGDRVGFFARLPFGNN